MNATYRMLLGWRQSESYTAIITLIIDWFDVIISADIPMSVAKDASDVDFPEGCLRDGNRHLSWSETNQHTFATAFGQNHRYFDTRLKSRAFDGHICSTADFSLHVFNVLLIGKLRIDKNSFVCSQLFC